MVVYVCVCVFVGTVRLLVFVCCGAYKFPYCSLTDATILGFGVEHSALYTLENACLSLLDMSPGIFGVNFDRARRMRASEYASVLCITTTHLNVSCMPLFFWLFPNAFRACSVLVSVRLCVRV